MLTSKNSAILKDEDRLHPLRFVRARLFCRCDFDGTHYLFNLLEDGMTVKAGKPQPRLDPDPMPRRDFLGLSAL